MQVKEITARLKETISLDKNRQRMRYLIILGFLIICPAKGNSISNLENLTLDQLLNIKITGSTQSDKDRLSVPASVTVFDHAQIQQLGVDSLDELMNLVPGFQSYRTSFSALHYPYSSRGSRIGLPSAEILILVDGQRLDEPRTSGAAVVIPKISVANIERVEFIRGPGSALYGSNAMMGVINIVTRSGINQVSFATGSLKQRGLKAFYNHHFENYTLDIFTQFRQDDGEDFLLADTFSGAPRTTDDPRETFDIHFKLSSRLFTFNLQHHQFEAQKFYEVNNLTGNLNRRKSQLTSMAVESKFNWSAMHSSIQLSHRVSDFSTARLASLPDAFSSISQPASNDPLFVEAKFHDYTESQFVWRNTTEFTDTDEFQFGLDFRQIDAPESYFYNNFDLGDIQSNTRPIRFYGEPLPTTPVQAKSSRDILGVYAQYQTPLSQSLELTVGVRYDHFSSIGQNVSPRLALVKKLDGSQSVKLLYGEAFRAPAENELNLLATSAVLGNPQLKSEVATNWELKWVKQWESSTASIGFFTSDINDSIVLTNAPRIQYVNQENYTVKGIEAEATYEINKSWIIYTTYSQFDFQTKSGLNESEQLASMIINYNQSSWNFNFSGYYHGERELVSQQTAPTNTLDSYWLFAFKGIYAVNHNLSTQVQIKNLFDNEYMTPPMGQNIFIPVPNRGREITIGLEWNF